MELKCECGWIPKPGQLVRCDEPTKGPYYCPDCGTVLTTDSDGGAEVTLDCGVSQPVRYGKDFRQFVHFRNMIIEGKKPAIVGPDYVVMSRQHYDELHSR